MGETHPFVDYAPWEALSQGHGHALVLASLVVLALLVAHALVRVMRARHALAALAREDDATRSLAEGPAQIVGVAIADGHAPVATLRVRQRGRNRRFKRHRWQEWWEIERTTSLRPFTIVTAAGPVEVDLEAAAIRTPALRTEGIERFVRDRVASIVPGEQVTARGALVRTDASGPYRGGARWRLVPDRGRAILSSVPRGAPARAQASAFASAASWLTAIALVSQVVVLGTFWLRVATGHVEIVEVTRVSREWHDDSRGQRFSVRVAHLASHTLSLAASIDDDLEIRAGDRVPVVVAWPTAPSLGRTAHVDSLAGLAWVLIVGLTFGGYVSWTRRVRPWWQPARLDEEEPGWIPRDVTA
jgi:hypothetical protein